MQKNNSKARENHMYVHLNVSLMCVLSSVSLSCVLSSVSLSFVVICIACLA